jgi:hypothetical protein
MGCQRSGSYIVPRAHGSAACGVSAGGGAVVEVGSGAGGERVQGLAGAVPHVGAQEPGRFDGGGEADGADLGVLGA